jgi:hypothetical protein
MKVTYAKLRESGDWGVRVEDGEIHPGETVTVSKKNGQTRHEIIDQVIWSSAGVTLASIQNKRSVSSRDQQATQKTANPDFSGRRKAARVESEWERWPYDDPGF